MSRESAGRAGGSCCCACAAANRASGMWRWPMRRVMYLFLPSWPIDRLRRLGSVPSLPTHLKNSGAPAEEAPFATIVTTRGQHLLAAVNPAAASAGLAPGMKLADALSFLPGLATAAAEPASD